LLLIGRATASRENTPEGGQGTCRISSTGGPLPGTTTSVFIMDASATENVSQVVVSDVLPAGQHSFNLECNETDSDRELQFAEAGIAAVAISPS
jgi:molybdopterin biosynthesis enzyme